MKPVNKSILIISVLLCVSLCIGTVVTAASASTPNNSKTALFCGDGICFGIGGSESQGVGVESIVNKFALNATNASEEGAGLTGMCHSRVVDQISRYCTEGVSFDYVILQGGVNDALGISENGQFVACGEMTDSFDCADFDTDTFAGALEELFCRAVNANPGAAIGYIYTFTAPVCRTGHVSDMEDYYAVADSICAKWNIQVLDLYRDRYVNNTVLDVRSTPNDNLSDALELTGYGMKKLGSYIGEWISRMCDRETYTAFPFKNKRALFIGDSISYGAYDSPIVGRGWAARMADILGIKSDNRSVSGATISTIRLGRVVTQLSSAPIYQYDYVIMHGGINDSWGNDITPTPPAPAGSVSDSYLPEDFDTSTFAGGLEELFYKAYTRFPNARLGFIINFDTIFLADMIYYVNVAHKVCEKWKVACLDMHSDRYVTETLLHYNSTEYVLDGAHPSGKGYDSLAPYISEWFKTIPYADISDFELKLLPKDTTPGLTVFRRVEAAIGAIGEVTQDNYAEKEPLIKAAEEQLALYLELYGDECAVYVDSSVLTAAREASDGFRALETEAPEIMSGGTLWLAGGVMVAAVATVLLLIYLKKKKRTA